MKRKYIILLSFIAFLILSYAFISIKGVSQNDKWIPREGFVPNESTARKVAEAVLLPIYGDEVIEEQKPFDVKLIGDSLWVVEGVQDEISIGGVVYISFLKRNCSIIEVRHGE